MPDAQQNPGMLASLLCLVVGLTIASPLVLAADQVVRGPARVLDGDTIVIAGEHVRLLAIDAPEGGQTCQAAGQDWPCGDAAGAALSKLTAGHEVVCRAPARDRYRRLLGTCFVDELNLNAEMVRLGYALPWIPRGGVPGPDYGSEAKEARAAHRGMWRGQFVEPWVWRHERR
jgi:endonuclease YncB( thermonuclease family)